MFEISIVITALLLLLFLVPYIIYRERRFNSEFLSRPNFRTPLISSPLLVLAESAIPSVVFNNKHSLFINTLKSVLARWTPFLDLLFY